MFNHDLEVTVKRRFSRMGGGWKAFDYLKYVLFKEESVLIPLVIQYLKKKNSHKKYDYS
jgi:hypothetical protein